jgi:hypothetical protein
LIKVHQTSEQVIDVITRDRVLFAGASQQTAKRRASYHFFRDYIDKHKAEITALNFSTVGHTAIGSPNRCSRAGEKAPQEHAAWTEDRL